MTSLLITCEHGGKNVPLEYQSLFASAGARRDLQSHQGYDPGALDATFQFSEHFGAEPIVSDTTRLLVDLNRSLDNPTLYSKFTSNLTEASRAELLKLHYHPYRDRVMHEVKDSIIAAGRVIHLSIHTFTPRFRGHWRPIDVGLLFDLGRSTERTFCERWRQSASRRFPRIRLVENQPYNGTDDGLTTELRRHFQPTEYLGIEVEINHRYWKRSVGLQRKIVKALLETIPHNDPKP